MRPTHSIRLFASVLLGACLLAVPQAEASSTNVNDNADEFVLHCTWSPDFTCAPGAFTFTASTTCKGDVPDPFQLVSISASFTATNGTLDSASTIGTNEVTLNLSDVGPGSVKVTFSGAGDSFSTTVWALKVDVVQEREDYCIHTAQQTLVLTADSVLGPNPDAADWYWEDDHVGTGRSYSFTPSEYEPCSVTVRARAQVRPACTDTCRVNIIKVDLDVEGVADEDEENAPGALLCVTNGPGQTVTRKQITVNKCEPATWDGHVTLLWSAGNVKVYTAATEGDEVTTGKTYANADLPKSLWVEGTAPSTAAGDVVFRLNPVEATCPNAATGCDRVVMTVIAINFAVSVDDHPGWADGILFDNCSNTVAITVTGIDDPSCLAFSFQSYPEQEGQLINKAGTNIDFFQTEALLIWKTSRSYWYGVLPDRCCYKYLHNYIFLLKVNGGDCVVSNRYCVNWPQEDPHMAPSVSDSSKTIINEPEQVPGITNYFRCLIEFGDFDKSTQTVGIPTANQYAEETTMEEEFHAQQFLGTVSRDQGGQSDCFTAKGIKWMIGWVGEGPWYEYGTTPEQVQTNAIMKVASAEQLEKDMSWEIWALDHGFVELNAKEHAGYNAAFKYHCTYERIYGPTPTNHHHRAYGGQ